MRALGFLDRQPSWLLGAIVVAVAAVVILATHDPRVAAGGDNALYWALASSLAGGEGYRNLVAPGAPLETSVPWGFPALLALPKALFGMGYTQAKLLTMACAVGAIACFWGLLEHLLDGRRGVALVVALLVALSTRVLGFASLVLSESPYLLLSLAGLWAFEASSERRWLVLPAALLISLSYLTRPVAIALIAALFLFLLVSRRWRDLGISAAVVAVVDGSWHAWAWLARQSNDNLYLDHFLKKSKFQEDDSVAGAWDLVFRVTHNAWGYATEILPRFVVSGQIGVLDIVLTAIPVLLAVAIGWVVMLRHRPRLAHAYVPLYMAVLLLWLPEAVTLRYFSVVWPLLLVFAAAGVLALVDRRPRVAGWVVLALALVLGGFQVHQLARKARRMQVIRTHVAAGELQYGRAEDHLSYMELLRWVDEHAVDGAVLGVRKPRIAWFYTGHQALRLPTATDPAELLSWLEDNRIDYLLLDHLDEKTDTSRDRFAGVLAAWPERFHEVYRTEADDVVLEIRPASGP